ncbi:metaxin-1 isoform X1 [Hylaeus volcanicus]|uniref:metaxin-1 isoform X1 n=1 Tax=Hylaeus volcanicus TaxID=313075 RepID=UPI0023B83446|nr:metaxin-1 isoform X1 [Hylaeus volcanicus]XP_053976646.1 metaxin-1 isoform X1 [Hylaeus volcanicus]
MEVLELSVWKGDWGLPSIDVECLQILAYAKFNGISLKVNTSGNPFNALNGRLPVLKSSSGTFDTVKEIVQYFREKNYNTESELTEKECAIVVAYDVMLKEKLLPAIKFIWWLDKKNLDELIRPWYCKALPFPLNFYYPGKFERQTREMFDTLYPNEDSVDAIENQVYSEAQKCLTLLSTRLGDLEYFFGEKPTILDAIIYSYLALLLKVPLPNPALQNHLKACTNLVKYVSRISQRYFEYEYHNYEQRKAEENSQKMKSDSENDVPNKRWNQFLAGIFATLAMVGYAISTGIVERTKKGRHSAVVDSKMLEHDIHER